MPQEKFSTVLPENWDGTFPFTNESDEDFVFRWAKRLYTFPAQRTVDMMRMNFNATPVEVQQIRKFAAKQLAEREFTKGDKYKEMTRREWNPDGTPRLQNFHQALTYSEEELKDFIQRCLTPLPVGEPKVAPATDIRNTEAEIHVDVETGNPVTAPVKNPTQSLNDKPGYILSR